MDTLSLWISDHPEPELEVLRVSDNELEVKISRRWLVRGTRDLQRAQAGAGGLGESGRDAAGAAAAAKSLQSCPTLWDPIDGSPPGSPVPGILQASAPPPMGFSRQEYWSGVPLPSPQSLHQ